MYTTEALVFAQSRNISTVILQLLTYIHCFPYFNTLSFKIHESESIETQVQAVYKPNTPSVAVLMIPQKESHYCLPSK